MFSVRVKKMKVPVLLRPLHGNSITLRELSLVYWVALTFASIMAYSLSGKPSESDPLRLFILILLSMDLAGGAIANLCHGTRSYWRSQTRTLRLTFLVFHGIHGIGIIFVFPESVVAIVVAYCWMVGAGTFLILTNNTNALTALSLTLVGVTVAHIPSGIETTQSLLICVFLLKLVFSFSGGPSQKEESV